MSETTQMVETVDVRMLVPGHRHQKIFQLVDNLQPGKAFVLVNDHDPKPLYYQLEAEYPGQFSWTYLERGPDIWRVEIGKQKLRILVENLRAYREFQLDRRPGLARTAPAHAMAAAPGLEMLLVSKIDKRIQVILGDCDDIAATPAIASVRPPEFDKFLTPEAARSGTAIAALDEDLGRIEKPHLASCRATGKGKCANEKEETQTEEGEGRSTFPFFRACL